MESEKNMSTVHERIKEVRGSLKSNQKAFAEELGISQTHVSNLEKGNDNPSPALLKLISSKFNINEEWLKTGLGSMTVEFDHYTDDGLIAKYNEMRVALERRMRERQEEELRNTVEAFSNLVSILSANKLKEEERILFLSNINQALTMFESILFQASVLDITKKISKTKVEYIIDFKESSNAQLSKINKLLSECINLYLKR